MTLLKMHLSSFTSSENSLEQEFRAFERKPWLENSISTSIHTLLFYLCEVHKFNRLSRVPRPTNASSILFSIATFAALGKATIIYFVFSYPRL